MTHNPFKALWDKLTRPEQAALMASLPSLNRLVVSACIAEYADRAIVGMLQTIWQKDGPLTDSSAETARNILLNGTRSDIVDFMGHQAKSTFETPPDETEFTRQVIEAKSLFRVRANEIIAKRHSRANQGGTRWRQEYPAPDRSS